MWTNCPRPTPIATNWPIQDGMGHLFGMLYGLFWSRVKIMFRDNHFGVCMMEIF